MKLKIIAEIGVNHEGSYKKACELLLKAVDAGADCVKFQSYTTEKYIAATDVKRRARVKSFSLSEIEFKKLATLAKEHNVEFMSTPVTEDWVERLQPLCKQFKIASGDITFRPVIQKVAQTGKPILLSTGASTLDEIDQAVAWVQQEVGSDQLYNRLTLMHCVSSYPVPLEEANIRSIPFLQKRYGLRVGYSNHVKGMSACLAAVAHGAEVVEVHFTDCKEGREFRDHALSFDPEDLRIFVTMAHEISKSLGVFEKIIQPCEKEILPQLRKGIIAARDVAAGQVLSYEDLMFARPATEFTSNELDKIVGKVLTKDVSSGFLIPKSSVECAE